jgi:hypothetical protein
MTCERPRRKQNEEEERSSRQKDEEEERPRRKKDEEERPSELARELARIRANSRWGVGGGGVGGGGWGGGGVRGGEGGCGGVSPPRKR